MTMTQTHAPAAAGKAPVYSYRQIWTVAYPILISLVMEQMIGMTDTAFMGRVGEVELGASAIAGIFYMVVFMIGFGFSIGSQIIIARRNGEGRFQETGNVFYHGVCFLTGLAAVMVVLSEMFSPWLMEKMVSSPEIAEAALSYVKWRLPGLFFAYVTAMFRAFYVGTTQTRTLTLNSITMVLSNVVFNWILVFGKFGIPAMGIAGAAIGSTLAELVSLIFFIAYTMLKTDCRKYGLNRFGGFHFRKLGDILSVSVWTMVQNAVSISTWFIFFLFIEHLGERSLAISNIIRNVSGLIWMVLMAFASTCSSLVSNIIGNGHPDAVKGLVTRILKLGYSAVAVMIILIAAFPRTVLRIYTNIPEIIEASVPSLWVLCSAYLLTVPANIFFQAASGTGNTRTSFLLELASLMIYMLYCWFIMHVIRADVAVCWTAEHVYGGAMTLLCGWYLLSGRWKNRQI